MKTKTGNEENIVDKIYYISKVTLLVCIPILIVSVMFLSLPYSFASISSKDRFTVSVLSSCTLSSSVDTDHNVNTINGTYVDNVGKTTITTFCNDRNGYVVYVVGDSNDTLGNNKLINNNNNTYDITSGTATSGDVSNWAMKLNTTSQGDDTPTIEQTWNNQYGIVPTIYTRAVSKPSGTNMTSGSSFNTTYAIFTSPTQPAGNYTGQVKYLLVHPSNANPDGVRFMQDVADWEDEIPNSGDSLVVEDRRDGKSYWVTRLADGHIWMTQNLDLDLSSNIALTSDNTDLNVYNVSGYTDGYTINNGVIYWTPTNTTIDFSSGNNSTISGWVNSNTIPYSANKIDDTNTGHASLGNYYNWTAVIASNDSSTFTSDTLNNIQNNPKNSICPKGWRLPTISSDSASALGSTNEFARLNYLYNNGKTNTDAGLIVSPLYFMRSGYIPSFKDYLSSLNIEGLYRTSTIGSGVNSYSIDFLASKSDYYLGSRASGYSVRCVAR